METKKSAIILSMITSKVQIVCGIILAALFIGPSFGLLADKVDLFVVMLIIGALGIILIVSGLLRGNLIKLFKTYLSLLLRDPKRSIDTLAAAANMPSTQVKRNLARVIEKGYFKNARIDEATNCLVFGREEENINQNTSENVNIQADDGWIPVNCKACGAPGKVQRGRIGSCEYCGSPIK